MIIINIAAPSNVERGGSVIISAANSFHDSNPFSAVEFSWQQTAGPAGTLDASGPFCTFSPPSDASPSDTFTIQVTATALNESSVESIQLGVREPVNSNELTLIPGIETNCSILPRGGFSFNIRLNGTTEIIRMVHPSLLNVQIVTDSHQVNIPFSFDRIYDDLWKITVDPVPAGDRILKRTVEQLPLLYQTDGRPYVTLRHSIEFIEGIIAYNGSDQPVIIPMPFAIYDQGDPTVLFHRLTGIADNIEIIEVDYWHLDTSSFHGWFNNLGLGPYDAMNGKLIVSYGPKPSGPDVISGSSPWGNIDRPSAQVPVLIGGCIKLHPYYHIWKQEGNTALLREPYEGIIRE